MRAAVVELVRHENHAEVKATLEIENTGAVDAGGPALVGRLSGRSVITTVAKGALRATGALRRRNLGHNTTPRRARSRC